MTKQMIFSPVCLLLLILSGFVSCNNQPRDIDCNKFRTGNFYIKATKVTSSYSIRRNDSIQYETNDKTGSVRMYDVKWIKPCEYELKLLQKSTDSATLNQSMLQNSLEEITSTIVVLKTTADYYVFEVKKKGIKMSAIDTMWVMK